MSTGGSGGNYSAVILAAGLSSRMKAFKPLLDVGGDTAIGTLVKSVRAAGIEDILVVTGSRRQLLEESLAELGVREVYNPNYEDGMFTSIQRGLETAAALWGEKRGYLLMPVDCPLIRAETMRAVIAEAEAGMSRVECITSARAARTEAEAGTAEAAAEEACPRPNCYYVPTYEGKKGHPLLILAGSIQEILEHDGDGGLKAVTDRHPERMVRVPVSDEGCVLDMDTPQAWAELCEYAANGSRRNSLQELCRGRRLFLVRHGETAQHEEPMFIGQYDVPLSEKGRRQAEEAGRRIREMMTEKAVFPCRIYCSDLARAKETARRIASQLAGGPPYSPAETAGAGAGETFAEPVQLIPESDLREISLGAWDGRPVREIKEAYPEAYARRGEDLFTFKTGNRAENFYDMQYRAVKALRRILEKDPAEELIIVAHSGVIRALENNLRGRRVDDDWDPLPKGGVRVIAPACADREDFGPEDPADAGGRRI